jgi:hypothetical protein
MMELYPKKFAICDETLYVIKDLIGRTKDEEAAKGIAKRELYEAINKSMGR